MIFEIIVALSLLMIGLVLWHIGYTNYKEREWRRNNPDEHNWTRNTINKDNKKGIYE